MMAMMSIDSTRAGPGDDDDDRERRGGTGVATKTRPKTAKPALYKVLLLNDDYTPMEFVVLTLQRFFRMTIEDATRVMLPRPPARRRHLRHLHLRGRRDQGHPGHGLRQAAPAPAAVHARKGLSGRLRAG